MKYNKNLKKLIVPSTVTTILDAAFMDFDALEEVIIPDSVVHIGSMAFKGCKSLKKVTLSNKLLMLDDYAFSDCTSLEEITIPSSLHYFSKGVFKNCYNLKKINIHTKITYIDEYAFYNCHNLENFIIPESVNAIERMAFMGCDLIKAIYISKNVEFIGEGAFALMSSLETIVVDEENEKYGSLNNNTVLISEEGTIIQYAINCDYEEFIVGYYTIILGYDNDGNPVKNNCLIYNIMNYAFANAKKLKKIYIASEVDSIGGQTFKGCDNLKELDIFHSQFGDSVLLRIVNSPDKKIEIPFENVTINDGIKTLCSDLENLFKNAKEVILPESLETINSNVFSKSKYLNELVLPKNIKSIMPNTFYPEIEISFSHFGTMKAKEFNMLQTKTSTDYYINHHNKDNIRIFSLMNGTYYVKIGDFDEVKINRDEIINLSNSSHILADHPDDFLIYLIKLLDINAEHELIFRDIFMDKNLQQVFNKFVTDAEYVQEIAQHHTSKSIREIIDNSGIHDELLFSILVMQKFNQQELIQIFEHYNKSIDRFLKLDKVDKNKDRTIPVNGLIIYCDLLEKYQQYDRFLYNSIFLKKLDIRRQELLIKHFNENIKRLLNNSQTLEDIYGNNLSDLINMCKALGVFCDDEIISQRITTFLIEKVVNENNNIPIIGNNIHTIFGEIVPRENTDFEFILFFIEYYENLIELERNKSGIIARIYNYFREISKTSTSHKGSQKHLKITMQKCLDYFLAGKFNEVTEENKELAIFLQNFYTESYVLDVATEIVKQSKNAPRNIFSKVNYNENLEPIYSYDSNEDLKEQNNDNFSYHWLPKQDYDNLALGKDCNSCAHVIGAGAGIMRASMITDNHQNLVIRNEYGDIIAKMTIYVNKEYGYAVFNTAAVNLNHRNDDSIDKIYQAFMRGVNAFVDKYNENNIIPIKTVTIGEHRNAIKNKLGNIQSELYPTPNYSAYAYYANDKLVGQYDGDSKAKQLLVLKK